MTGAELQKLTQKQNAEIHCIKHGHADYVWTFWGYVYCGRCGQQIGDQLAGIYDTSNMLVVGHGKCKTCNSIKKKLSELDKKILARLEKSKDFSYDYEKILGGLVLK